MNAKYDYRKLIGKTVEKFGTVDNLAKVISMNRSTLSRKLNNHVDFSSKDIYRICAALDIPKSQIGEYFFCKES